MNEITSISLRNFQSHKYTKIVPAPAGGLTVITGPSDSGKTAIIRAMKWLLYNRPQGYGFIRVGASMVKVEVEVNNGKVTRQRSAAVNRYEVASNRYEAYDTPTKENVALEGFGGDVPLEVQEITGVRQTMIGDMPLNLNLAEQLDGPFLGSGISDPVRARILGKLAGTEEVDHANKQLGTDLYRRNQDLRNAEEEIARAQEQLTQFEHLPRLQELVAELGQLNNKISAGMSKVITLQSRKTELAHYEQSSKTLRRLIARLTKAEEGHMLVKQTVEAWLTKEELKASRHYLSAMKKAKDRETMTVARLARVEGAGRLAYRADSGTDIVTLYRRYQNSLGKAEDARSAAEERRDKLAFKLGHAELDLNTVSELAPRLKSLKGLGRDLYDAATKAKDSREMATAVIRQVDQLTDEYGEILLTLGKCPTCGNEGIDPKKIKEVI